MGKKLILGILGSLLLLTGIPLFGDSQATITVTVTIPSVISVSVTPTSWNIGNVSLGETKATSGGYFTVTNNGNVTEDISIVSGNSENWTVGSTAGEEVFTMKAKGGDLTDWTSIHQSQILKSGVEMNGSVSFDLQFTAPTKTSHVDTQQTISVTITASKTSE